MHRLQVKKDLFSLSENDLIALANALRLCDYKFVVTKPREWNVPDGVIIPFTKKETYQFIFDDLKSKFLYFSLECPVQNSKLNIPIGVFGVSPRNKVHFPLLINGFGREFLMMSFAQYEALFFNFDHQFSRAVAFKKLLLIRKNFLKNIFTFYYTISDTYNPIMSWGAKGEESLTRKNALAAGFFRTEVTDVSGHKEFYFGRECPEGQFNFILECSERWYSVFKSNQDAILHDRIDLEYGNRISRIQNFYLNLCSMPNYLDI